MSDSRYRVLALCSHPVQYMSPVLRKMAQHPQLNLHVAYCSLQGAQAALDPEFGTMIQWDIPLLDGYLWDEIPNRGSGSEGFLGLCNTRLWTLIRKGKFDVVICYVGYVRASFWIAYMAARITGTAFVFGTDASNLAPRDTRSWKILFKKLFWPYLFRLADQVIVPSSAGREMMRSLGISEDRVTITPFVVDNEWWISRAALTDRSMLRESLGVAPHQRAVLFCAKLQPWKRPLDLLRAFAQADVPDTHLIFAGEGPLRHQLESEACSLGISSRVHLLGFTNQSLLPAVYSAADLFVLPSDYDPCPAVICEAMLCGLPVILSDEIRGRFDLVRPGLTGDLFPCGNVEALAAVLRRLLLDGAKLAMLAKNARARMESWSVLENVAATVEAASRAIGHRKRRRSLGEVAKA